MKPNYQTMASRLSVVSVSALTAACLLACGGGGGGAADSASSTPAPAPAPTTTPLTAVYFTDDFSARYDAVWITVSRVTAVGPNGETELTAFTPARPFNLPQLKQAGSLIANISLPSGSTSIRVYVQSNAKLQLLDGSTLEVPLVAPKGWLEFRLESWAPESGVLALDFDLPKFELIGGQLNASTRLASKDDFSSWNHRGAELEGTVTATGVDRFTLLTRQFGTIDVQLSSNTSYWSKSRGASWRPLIGERVEVAANLAGVGNLVSYTALSVKDESEAASSDLGKLEGRIVAVDGKTITLAVRESQIFNATGTVRVQVASATYARGNEAMLQVGRKVEAYVTAVGQEWIATALEIDGAPPNQNDSSNAVRYGEVKGRIISVDGSTVKLTTLSTEWLPGVTLGSTLSVDLRSVTFKRGSLSCLVAGMPIEIKGSLDKGGNLIPLHAEVEGACASAYPSNGVSSPGTSQTIGPNAFVEAKGAVTAVRDGEFDIAVYQLEYGGSALASITIRYSAATIFKNLPFGKLSPGQFVEVKGNLTGMLLDASKVELD